MKQIDVGGYEFNMYFSQKLTIDDAVFTNYSVLMSLLYLMLVLQPFSIIVTSPSFEIFAVARIKEALSI